jgi:hypothetical protein
LSLINGVLGHWELAKKPHSEKRTSQELPQSYADYMKLLD